MVMVATLDNTIGLLYDAVVFSSILYGAGCLQAWFYFQKYIRRDKLWTKLLVTLVLIADTAQLGCLSAAVYLYTVTNQGNPLILAKIEKSLIVELYFSASIALLVQQFYCYRIYILSKSAPLALAVSALSVTTFVTLVVYTCKAMMFEDLVQLETLGVLSTVTNSFAAGTDVVISIVMILILQNSKTGFKRSTDLLNRLIIFTFNTGLPTSICALVAVVSINASPQTFLYIFFSVLMGRFYTNSILVTLNSREFILGASTDHGSENYTLSARNIGNSRNPAFSHTQPQEIAIRIDTTTQNYRPNDSNDMDKESGKMPV